MRTLKAETLRIQLDKPRLVQHRAEDQYSRGRCSREIRGLSAK